MVEVVEPIAKSCDYCEHGIVSVTTRCCNRCGESDTSKEEREQERSADRRMYWYTAGGAVAGLFGGLALELALNTILGLDQLFVRPSSIFCGVGASVAASRCGLIARLISEA